MATAIGEISASAIKRAQLSDNLIPLDSFAARIGACDPAGKGKKSDRTVFAVRQGKVLEKVLRFQGLTHPERVEVAAKIIRDEKLDMLFSRAFTAWATNGRSSGSGSTSDRRTRTSMSTKGQKCFCRWPSG
jgi:hypothetical protein